MSEVKTVKGEIKHYPDTARGKAMAKAEKRTQTMLRNAAEKEMFRSSDLPDK